jgi:hypothetical protein
MGEYNPKRNCFEAFENGAIKHQLCACAWQCPYLRKNSGREKVQCYKECPIQMTGFYVGLVGNGPA